MFTIDSITGHDFSKIVCNIRKSNVIVYITLVEMSISFISIIKIDNFNNTDRKRNNSEEKI